MTDYTKMDGPTMLREMGMDGQKWVDAFRQHSLDCNVDDGVLLAWFCNAIMNTYDLCHGTIHNGDHLQYLIDNNLALQTTQESQDAPNAPEGHDNHPRNATALQRGLKGRELGL